MTDIITDLWSDLLHGDTFDRVTSLVMMVVFAAVIGLVFWVVFYLVDSVGTTDRTIMAKGLSRKHTPAWTQTNMIMAGKVMIPQIIYHPERWGVKVVTEEEEVLFCNASKSVYNAFQKDALFNVSVSSGRLSGGTYCNSIY